MALSQSRPTRRLGRWTRSGPFHWIPARDTTRLCGRNQQRLAGEYTSAAPLLSLTTTREPRIYRRDCRGADSRARSYWDEEDSIPDPERSSTTTGTNPTGGTQDSKGGHDRAETDPVVYILTSDGPKKRSSTGAVVGGVVRNSWQCHSRSR